MNAKILFYLMLYLPVHSFAMNRKQDQAHQKKIPRLHLPIRRHSTSEQSVIVSSNTPRIQHDGEFNIVKDVITLIAQNVKKVPVPSPRKKEEGRILKRELSHVLDKPENQRDRLLTHCYFALKRLVPLYKTYQGKHAQKKIINQSKKAKEFIFQLDSSGSAADIMPPSTKKLEQRKKLWEQWNNIWVEWDKQHENEADANKKETADQSPSPRNSPVHKRTLTPNRHDYLQRTKQKTPRSPLSRESTPRNDRSTQPTILQDEDDKTKGQQVTSRIVIPLIPLAHLTSSDQSENTGSLDKHQRKKCSTPEVNELMNMLQKLAKRNETSSQVIHDQPPRIKKLSPLESLQRFDSFLLDNNQCSHLPTIFQLSKTERRFLKKRLHAKKSTPYLSALYILLNTYDQKIHSFVPEQTIPQKSSRKKRRKRSIDNQHASTLKPLLSNILSLLPYLSEAHACFTDEKTKLHVELYITKACKMVDELMQNLAIDKLILPKHMLKALDECYLIRQGIQTPRSPSISDQELHAKQATFIDTIEKFLKKQSSINVDTIQQEASLLLRKSNRNEDILRVLKALSRLRDRLRQQDETFEWPDDLRKLIGKAQLKLTQEVLALRKHQDVATKDSPRKTPKKSPGRSLRKMASFPIKKSNSTNLLPKQSIEKRFEINTAMPEASTVSPDDFFNNLSFFVTRYDRTNSHLERMRLYKKISETLHHPQFKQLEIEHHTTCVDLGWRQIFLQSQQILEKPIMIKPILMELYADIQDIKRYIKGAYTSMLQQKTTDCLSYLDTLLFLYNKFSKDDKKIISLYGCVILDTLQELGINEHTSSISEDQRTLCLQWKEIKKDPIKTKSLLKHAQQAYETMQQVLNNQQIIADQSTHKFTQACYFITRNLILLHRYCQDQFQHYWITKEVRKFTQLMRRKLMQEPTQDWLDLVAAINETCISEQATLRFLETCINNFFPNKKGIRTSFEIKKEFILTNYLPILSILYDLHQNKDPSTALQSISVVLARRIMDVFEQLLHTKPKQPIYATWKNLLTQTYLITHQIKLDKLANEKADLADSALKLKRYKQAKDLYLYVLNMINLHAQNDTYFRTRSSYLLDYVSFQLERKELSSPTLEEDFKKELEQFKQFMIAYTKLDKLPGD